MIQYIALVLLATQVSTYSIDGSKQLSKINLGKNQLANWQQNSQWSNCWRDAILALEEGCKQDNTNDESRGKLAVALANCHLSRSGLATYHCTNQMTVRECTKDMLSSNVAFHTYTEFTTHVDNICFYLQSEMFQQRTEKSINMLLDGAEAAISNLKQLNIETGSIQTRMADALTNQEVLIKTQNHLHVLLDSIKTQEIKHFEDMKSNWETVSNGLHKSISAIADEQDYIFKEQNEWHAQTLSRFEQIKLFNAQLDANMKQNIEQSTKLGYAQDNLHAGIIEVQKEQMKSYNKILESFEIQQETLQGQQNLKLFQQEMHEHTKDALEKLDGKSIHLANSLEKSIVQQQELSTKQKEAHDELKMLKESQKQAFVQAQASLVDLMHYSEETTKTIHKHQQSFVESFDKLFDTVRKLLTVHTSLIGEFMDLQSILFYTSVIVVSYCLTATQYTANSRIILFATLTVNILVEKSIIMQGLRHALPREDVYWRVWLSRKIFISLCGFILFLSWYLYRDYSAMSYKLLQEMRSELRKPRRSVSNFLTLGPEFDKCTSYTRRSILKDRYRMLAEEAMDCDSENSDAE